MGKSRLWLNAKVQRLRAFHKENGSPGSSQKTDATSSEFATKKSSKENDLFNQMGSDVQVDATVATPTTSGKYEPESPYSLRQAAISSSSKRISIVVSIVESAVSMRLYDYGYPFLVQVNGVDLVSIRVDGAKIKTQSLIRQIGFSNVVHLLKDQQYQTREASYFSATPLHVAARNGHHNVVDLLISKGSNIEAPDEIGNTPLHAASMSGCDEAVRLLVRHGSPIEMMSNMGRTPLHLAAAQGHRLVVSILCASGADVHVVDHLGRSPIFYAIMHGFAAIVNILLSKGADHLIRDFSGKTACNWADENGHTSILRLVAAHEARLATSSVAKIHEPPPKIHSDRRSTNLTNATAAATEHHRPQPKADPFKQSAKVNPSKAAARKIVKGPIASSSSSSYEAHANMVDPMILRWE